MCGIAGVLVKNKFIESDIKVFNNLMYITGLRGFHSTGVIVKDKSSVKYFKSTAPVYNFLSTNKYKKLVTKSFPDLKWMIGHCRHATVGDITKTTAHPFRVNNIIGVHNGTLKNNIGKEVSDSAWAIKQFANKTPDEYKDVVEKMNGAYVFVLYNTNTKKIYILRNTERTLYFTKNSSDLWFASEDTMLDLVLSRARRNTLADNIQAFKSGIVYEINPVTLDIKELDTFKPFTYTYSSEWYSTEYSSVVKTKTVILTPIKFSTYSQIETDNVYGRIELVDKNGNKYIATNKTKDYWEQIKDKQMIGKYKDYKYSNLYGSILLDSIEENKQEDKIKLGDGTLLTIEDWNRLSEKGYDCCDTQGITPKNSYLLWEQVLVCGNCLPEFMG